MQISKETRYFCVPKLIGVGAVRKFGGRESVEKNQDPLKYNIFKLSKTKRGKSSETRKVNSKRAYVRKNLRRLDRELPVIRKIPTFRRYSKERRDKFKEVRHANACLRALEMFQELGNQSECLAGARWNEGEYDWSGSNIVGLETAVSHRERSRLRPICCGVNDLVTALCQITSRGPRQGYHRVKAAARTSLIVNFLSRRYRVRRSRRGHGR